ncbi:proline dehydrogenase/oxidase [Haematococcus lacustris]
MYKLAAQWGRTGLLLCHTLVDAQQKYAALVVHSHSFSVSTVQQPLIQGASLLSAQPHVPPSIIYRAHSTAALSGRKVPPKLDFNDNRAIFRGQPTSAVLRALLVFHACGWSWFVAHAEQLLSASKRLLGTRLTLLLVRKSFFDHFCGGETSEEVWLTMRKLEQRGIGAILDFAAEDDMQSSSTSSGSNADGSTVRQASQTLGSDDSISTSTSSPQPSLAQTEVQQRRPQGQQQDAAGQEPHQMSARVVARQYSYKSEVQCDAHVDIFLKSIHAAAGLSRQGFTAVKLTALGNPLLLQRISLAIREVRGLFARFDADGSGSIDQAEFQAAYREMLPDADTEEVQRVFSWLQGNQAGGKVDYVAWCQRLSLTKMPQYAARIQRLRLGQQQQHSAGSPDSWVQSLQALVLSEEEVQLVTAMRARLHRLAQEAAGKGVRLMVDAEHTYFQPAIDHLTLELMRDHNRGPAGAVIFNTYQAYLTDSHGRLRDDLERSRRDGYVLGAKLVRGAYLDLERRHAAKQGQPSPVWPSLQATHDNYHACMELLLQAVVEGRAEVLLGTHNQASVELAVARMSELGLQPQGSNVYFGQLLGMSDHLTQTLGAAGYKCFKYVPYGEVEQVLPYLLRRAAENSNLLKGAKRDIQLLRAELRDRVFKPWTRLA